MQRHIWRRRRPMSQKSSKLLKGHHKLSSPPEWSLGRCHLLILHPSLCDLSYDGGDPWEGQWRVLYTFQPTVQRSWVDWNTSSSSAALGNPHLGREAQVATKLVKLTEDSRRTRSRPFLSVKETRTSTMPVKIPPAVYPLQQPHTIICVWKHTHTRTHMHFFSYLCWLWTKNPLWDYIQRLFYCSQIIQQSTVLKTQNNWNDWISTIFLYLKFCL